MSELEKMSNRDLLLRYADCHEHDYGDDDEYSELMRRLAVYEMYKDVVNCCYTACCKQHMPFLCDCPKEAYCIIHKQFDCKGA